MKKEPFRHQLERLRNKVNSSPPLENRRIIKVWKLLTILKNFEFFDVKNFEILKKYFNTFFELNYFTISPLAPHGHPTQKLKNFPLNFEIISNQFDEKVSSLFFFFLCALSTFTPHPRQKLLRWVHKDGWKR